MAQLSDYINRIIPEHQAKPNFIAWLSATVQAFVDLQNAYADLTFLFDLDTAQGQELDAVGLRVGATRNLRVPLTGVYFSWDTDGVGWDQGNWIGPFDDGDVMYQLQDSDFRTLIRATIAANNWNGTVENAYKVWKIVFDPLGYTLLIQDNQDMTIDIVIVGPTISAVVAALLTQGSLILVPAGVMISGYFTPSVPEAPMFGFDLENAMISGWDTGAWVEPII